MTEIAVADVVFREDLYPRIETNAATVQKYEEDLSVLPPIELNEDNELIDGWHRWTAHKNREATTIHTTITETGIGAARKQLEAAEESGEESSIEKAKSAIAKADSLLLELAIDRNAKFGFQLSTRDKKAMARRIYRDTPAEERGTKKKRLAEILSMSESTIHEWLKRIDKDTEEERNAAVLNLYLQCYTQEEIADAVGMKRETVAKLLVKIPDYEILPIPGTFTDDQPQDSATAKKKKDWEEQRKQKIIEHNRANAEHESEFDVPIYNIWKQQTKSEGSSHYGNSEVTWVDRLLYLYTQPFDVVIDPFAGGGSTLDICKQRFRRCWLSDRKPIEERSKEIRELDVTESLPDLRKRWSDVKLVYLDPPYWCQAKGKYSDDPTDLANMELEEFNKTLSKLIKDFAKKLTDARIALIISPTQWPAPEKQFTDHVGDMLRLVNLPVDMRYSVPYESQQYNGNQVEWAKENKRCLVLSREIVVWRTGHRKRGHRTNALDSLVITREFICLLRLTLWIWTGAGRRFGFTENRKTVLCAFLRKNPVVITKNFTLRNGGY